MARAYFCETTPTWTIIPILFLSYLQVFFKEASVKQVDVPTLTGAFGILPAHVPTLQVLRPGVVTVFNDDGSAAKYFGKSDMAYNSQLNHPWMCCNV